MSKEIYVGVNGLARKIKKAYVGVDGIAHRIRRCYVGDTNGKARLCWGSGEIGSFTSLEMNTYSGGMKAVSNDEYVIFNGGTYHSFTEVTYGTAYDYSLTKYNVSDMYVDYGNVYDPAVSKFNHLAVFAGGESSDLDDLTDYVRVYDGLTSIEPERLSVPRRELQAGALDNHCFVSGGVNAGIMPSDKVHYLTTDVYDKSLIRTSGPNLLRFAPSTSVRVGNNLLFGGDNSATTDNEDIITVYDDNSVVSSLRISKTGLSETAASIGEYGIFFGLDEERFKNGNMAIAFNKDLTEIILPILNGNYRYSVGIETNDYALFIPRDTTAVCMYDKSLTLQIKDLFPYQTKSNHIKGATLKDLTFVNAVANTTVEVFITE